MEQPISIQDSLEQAKKDGYVFDFSSIEDNDITFTAFELLKLKVISIIQFLPCGATLYRIEYNNIRGIYLDYWETPSL